MKNDDVAIPQQDEIQVYVNEEGGIAIVQIGADGNDSVVWLAAEHAETLCDAITKVARKALEGCE